MARIPNEERDWLDGMLREELRATANPVPHAVAARVIDRLWDEVRAYLPPDSLDQRTVPLLVGLAVEGAYKRATDILKEINKLRSFDLTGRELTMPGYVGIRTSPGSASADAGHRYEQRKLIDQVWEQVHEYVDGWRERKRTADDRIAQAEFLLTLQALHPASRTPREALIAAGYNPKDFDIDLEG